MVANKSIALVFSMILNPLGPIMIPDAINPMRLGILNFLSITGDISITRSIMANTRYRIIYWKLCDAADMVTIEVQ